MTSGTGRPAVYRPPTAAGGFTLLELAAVLFLIALFLGSATYFVSEGASWGNAEDRGSQLTLMAKKAARFSASSGQTHRIVLTKRHAELRTGPAGATTEHTVSVGDLDIGDEFEIWIDRQGGDGWEQPGRDGYDWEFYPNGLNHPLRIKLAGGDTSFYEVTFGPVAAAVQDIGFAEGGQR